ncbi:DUF695 domain-containing protein [Empedobacter stercoris]|uniref:DUF695 domain-containing protein n=1 Tax=Empedobacter stercoris TaxID=1628248 RepID=UPI001CE06174|nr:DUF695 domain-containing protein [Empedobacter stercoris]MCA4783142.1 DUF695 domain-containing protein [Empedobacter stercoris]
MKNINRILLFLFFMGFISNLFGQKKYPEEWNFYLTNIEDKCASIYLNLGLNDFVPIKEKTELCWISVKLKNPNENGLTTNEESEILFKIEDEIIKKTNAKNTIYIGRITNNGYRDFYFYSKNPETFKAEFKNIENNFTDYTVELNTKEDKDWSEYLNIYPNEMDFQSIGNRSVLENLKKNGDKLIKPREVFHWIYFKNDENRQKFIEIVKKENFEIVQTQYNNENDLPYVLQIKRVDKVGYSDIDEYTLYLWNLAKENNGEYDGWETSVETE